jgi:outer membrane lipoprotein carrier protein
MKKKELLRKMSGRFLGQWLVIGLLSLFGLGSALADEASNLESILSNLKERFAAAKTFQADYVRDLIPKIASTLPPASMQAEGKLSFSSPNKLRMDQKKPRPEQLMSNGEKVWWYLPEEKVVNVYHQKDYSAQIKPIIDFLSGLGGWENNFTVRLDGSLPEAPFYQLLLKPSYPQPDLQQIQVRLSKTTFLPLEFTFHNLLGDGTRFRFSKVQTGISLSPSWFEFIRPQGIRVVSPSLPSLPKK